MEEKILCKCGCGKEIIVKPHMKYSGIPKYLRGHNPKKGLNNKKIISDLNFEDRKKKYQDPRYLRKKILNDWMSDEDISKSLPKHQPASPWTIKKYRKEFDISYNQLIYEKLKKYNEPILIIMPGSKPFKTNKIEITRRFVKHIDETWKNNEELFTYSIEDFVIKNHGRGVINIGNKFEYWNKLILTIKPTKTKNIYNIINFKLSEIYAHKEMRMAFPELSKIQCETMILNANKDYIFDKTKVIWRK